MFQLEDTFTYSWPVTVRRPSLKAPGEFDEFKFTAIFRAWSDDDVEAYNKEVAEDAVRPAAEQKLRRDEILHRVLTGWDEVNGADGKTLAFNEAALKRMLQHPWNRIGLYTAWNESNNPEARRKGN